jgi:predicted nucleic acid-binding protein
MSRPRQARKRSVPGRATRGVTFDTGVLIALERRNASALALFCACRESRARITIPAGVVAEWWRGAHRALLESGTVEALSPELAQAAGELLAKTGKSNAVDASVIASAAQRGDLVVTDDPYDLRELAATVQGVTVEGVK